MCSLREWRFLTGFQLCGMGVKELQWNTSLAKIFWAVGLHNLVHKRKTVQFGTIGRNWGSNLVSLRTPVSWDCSVGAVCYWFLMVIKSQLCGWAEDLESAPKVLFLSVCHHQQTGWFFSVQALGLTCSCLNWCQDSGQAWSQVKLKPCWHPRGCSLNISWGLKLSWQVGPR